MVEAALLSFQLDVQLFYMFTLQVTAYPLFKKGTNVDEVMNQMQVTFPDEVVPKGLDDARKWQLYDDIRPFVYHHNSDEINVKDCGM